LLLFRKNALSKQFEGLEKDKNGPSE
jgi:hypothetical protein